MSLLKKITVGLLVTALASAGAVLSLERAIAQDIDPLEGLGTDDDGTGPFGGADDPFDLFHRAVLAPSVSPDEFNEQQQQAIDSEVEAFRLRQQEAFRQQPSVEPQVVDVDGTDPI